MKLLLCFLLVQRQGYAQSKKLQNYTFFVEDTQKPKKCNRAFPSIYVNR